MEPILSVRELTKTFSRPGQGKLTAVNGVSFDLRPGERPGDHRRKRQRENHRGKPHHPAAGRRRRAHPPGRGGHHLRHRPGPCAGCTRKIQMVFQTPAESFDPRRTLGDGVGESLRGPVPPGGPAGGGAPYGALRPARGVCPALSP